MNDLSGKVALVTGASRGIGAAVARMLAERGAAVAINYRSKGPRAEEVARAVRAEGRRALLAQADLTSETEVAAMMRNVEAEFARLDLLVLNASGGMEKGKDAGYAMELNFTAQVRLLDLALPLLPAGGRVVFVTSHLAHFYGRTPVYPVYESVAASKHAGEQALRARIPDLAARGVRLVVVSGDLIAGTITPRLMDRSSPGLIASRREQAGTLPTVEDFARAIVDAASEPALESGATLFVGSTD
jgi:NAD(P)-dependent dehydrogenase (short-subunit alcohol dehydrogenase family)